MGILRPTLAALLVIIAMAMAPMAHGKPDESPKAVKKWFKNLIHAEEKLTNLHFYFHDTLSGKNPIATTVAQSNTTSKPPMFFGAVTVIDDPLTAGPEPGSKILGFARGMYTFASMEEIGLLMTMNFVFVSGKYNGSTLSVLGHNPVFHEYRELPIMGGSGDFRLALGIATAKTYKFDLATGDAIVEYHASIVHH